MRGHSKEVLQRWRTSQGTVFQAEGTVRTKALSEEHAWRMPGTDRWPTDLGTK